MPKLCETFKSALRKDRSHLQTASNEAASRPSRHCSKNTTKPELESAAHSIVIGRNSTLHAPTSSLFKLWFGFVLAWSYLLPFQKKEWKRSSRAGSTAAFFLTSASTLPLGWGDSFSRGKTLCRAMQLQWQGEKMFSLSNLQLLAAASLEACSCCKPTHTAVVWHPVLFLTFKKIFMCFATALFPIWLLRWLRSWKLHMEA